MNTLIIDNYDSFTFNLCPLVATITGRAPLVIKNDQLSWKEFCLLAFDVIIISPGPGKPDNLEDFGICGRVIQEARCPLLGVCLGHQGICHYYGGSVVHAPEPMHGRISSVYHNGEDLFLGIANGFEATRYHSLMAMDPLPACLEKTAWTEDGVIMALRHRSKPIWGVQFHPESICTPAGERILNNFYRLAAARRLGGKQVMLPTCAPAAPAVMNGGDNKRFVLWTKYNAGLLSPEVVFRELFADKPYAFWLDSATAGVEGQYSFMGGADYATAEIALYSAGSKEVTLQRCGVTTTIACDIFQYVKTMLGQRYTVSSDLPFDFNCGYLGYWGYELKADCGAAAAHVSPYPDCALLFVDRQIVFDHTNSVVYLLYQGCRGEEPLANEWFQVTGDRLQHLAPASVIHHPEIEMPAFRYIQSRGAYIENIRRCLAYLRNGDSYEICLTNQLCARTDADPLSYYEVLRRINPAPYSAFIKFNGLQVACSSPERFLKVSRDLNVETKPIKGTAPRASNAEEDAEAREKLAGDVKSRAENLMIVDLLRNDLGRVCTVGTVEVPVLMNVETYATVHHLVSTVRGRLREDFTAVDCLQRAFPGGSMTGAPKLRTLAIIDELEKTARGIYSGAIGFLALNGAADLNITIRTAVFADSKVSIGAGGAIIALSDPAKEWDEMVLKTKALIRAFEVLAQSRSVIVRRASK